MLLFFCLLAGAGSSPAWAGSDTGLQLVLALDLPPYVDKSSAPDPWSQPAGLLVRLLKDQDYLGIAAPGESPGVILPLGKLTREHRAQALEKLAGLKPKTSPQPIAEFLPQVLDLFLPEGPKPRVVLLLTDGAREIDHQTKIAQEMGKITAQAQKAGVVIFSISLNPAAVSDVLKTLTTSTGGKFWGVKTVSEVLPCFVNFYEGLAQPQEAPINGADFRLDPWVKQAVVVAVRSAPGKNVVLTSPTGARITPRTQTRPIRWDAFQAYDLITISQPRPGVWRLAGARPNDSRVFLDTGLTLTTAGTPREVGADEALTVFAALSDHGKTLAGVHGLAGIEFSAELQVGQAPPLSTRLTVPAPGRGTAPPPGTRAGRFSPPHPQGDWSLRVLAQGKTFQRLISRPIAITKPWYRVALPEGDAQNSLPLRFQPDPGRHPEEMEGTVTLQSAQGSLAGVLINPAPGAEIIMAPPSGCQDTCLADLQLTGTGPGGRPLIITSGPLRLTTPQAVPEKSAEKPAEVAAIPAAEVKAQTSQPASPTRKSKRRWFGLAIVGMGLVFFGVAALLLWQERREDHEAEEEVDDDGASGKNVLRLKAQVESLAKEKAQLQADLEEKKHQAEQFQTEIAEVQAELERVRAKSLGNSKSLEDLEKKLAEAEREAKGVQQEYMALYARSQQEKETIKKN